MATRRSFLEKSTQLAAGALAAGVITVSTSEAQTQQHPAPKKKLHILMRSSWGTDDATRASFVFSHGLGLADAGHDVQIFLTHDATYLMRKATVDAIKPIGWPPLSETMARIVAKGIPVFSCGACSRARGVTEADLSSWNAQWGSPPIYISLVEWADHVISE
ncbi:MAG TPA: DsrE family protein [Terriglobales bacterium]|nr:DsrE family protein [Terriglobales bacterium]